MNLDIMLSKTSQSIKRQILHDSIFEVPRMHGGKVDGCCWGLQEGEIEIAV